MSLTHEEWERMLKKMPMVTVDAVVFKGDRILLVRRGHEPYKDMWGVPGGFLEYNETLEEGVKREVKEETGLSISIIDKLGIYDNPKRDPRGHIISIGFVAEARSGKLIPDPKEVSDLAFFDIIPSNLVPSHKDIIHDALKWKKERL